MSERPFFDRAAMRALHAAARVALRLQSPLAARRTVNRLAALLPPLAGAPEVLAAGDVLAARGTCLSRALAVSSRLRGSQVVIGIDPRRSAEVRGHAWVEWASEGAGGGLEIVYPREEGDRSNEVIARI